MTTARTLIINRRRREGLVGDFFANRLLRLDRNRSGHAPILRLFKNRLLHRAA